MLNISEKVSIPLREIEMKAIRSQGSGGQNVNKVSTAIHLFFDIRASSLPEACKERLLAMKDHRITEEGLVIIKAQETRTQEGNKEAALRRLTQLIQGSLVSQKKRKATRPSKGSKERRLKGKEMRGKTKALRGKVDGG